ncbi:BTB/POZ domain-containing protein 9-like protein [Leptotrombidium deliense]|uniref:BTB/POZ domain-containing protein 9-like protein n=1 Tax=Leptotrombidium deliense TaxID=299467 RepID=A0A443S5C4_9ACAR|nr:BTB/POZ domain-containing protein 9-like protein [Leptotrombidium deliense]
MSSNDSSYIGEARIKRIRMDSEFKDLTFLVEDMEIKANRTLMAASCDYFKVMLYGKTNESKMSRIKLNSTPGMAFKKVVEFVHTDECDIETIDEKHMLDLISLSHEYQFSHLLNYIYDDILLDGFSVDFCISLFDLSIEKQLNDFKDKCLQYFDVIFNEEVETDRFVKFSRRLVDELMLRDSFAISELDLFKCLLKWIEANGEEQSIGIFKNLRLNLINIKDFNTHVMPTKLISCEDYLIALENNTFTERAVKQKAGAESNSICVKKVINECLVTTETISLNVNQSLSFHMIRSKKQMNRIHFRVASGTGSPNFRLKVTSNHYECIPITVKRIASNVGTINGYDEYRVKFSDSTVQTFSISALSKPIVVHSYFVCSQK